MSDTEQQTIYRYDREISGLVFIAMPEGAKVLHAAASDRLPGGVAVWAQVKPSAPTEGRALVVVGTGNPMGPAATQGTHLSSFASGPFVWHVFDAGVLRMADPATPGPS